MLPNIESSEEFYSSVALSRVENKKGLNQNKERIQYREKEPEVGGQW
jgi:hypothetical protein